MPRTRPPFPAVEGLHGKPTIINNVETLGTLPNILRNGADWYSRYGTETSQGNEDVQPRREGAPDGPHRGPPRHDRCGTVIDDIGGGSANGFKAVQTGGPSGGCLGEEFLDSPIDYESLAAAGSIMGSGGLIVLDRKTCIVDTTKYFLNFTQAESCGKCVPCRVGTRHLVNILEKISGGQGEIADLARLERLAVVVKGSSLCGLGQTAPNPILTSLKYFRSEFLAHIVEKRCPAAVCRELVALPDHQGEVHRLSAVREDLSDGGHHGPEVRAPQPRHGQVHQVPVVLRDLPVRRHRRRRHRHRVRGALRVSRVWSLT